jgi:retron-type reverse transcriptase
MVEQHLMRTTDYDRMCALENLRRAYRWILSNPDVRYKSFFRDSYSAYAASSDYNLGRLRKHLVRSAYQPNHASKVYFPKPSGVLRPYTLLNVEDQIVYQACVNVIAERLHPKIKKRHLKNIFGHIYAGKSSAFFYIKWQKGYHAYSRAVVDHVNKGFVYIADFDLTSFYDTIDHSVLRYFLDNINVDSDLTDFFLACLKTWTSSTWTNLSNAIYHSHGIPQGPLSSGLLSEVILRHIDERGTRLEWRNTSKYLRYVDDIRILAKRKELLKQRLIALDLAAKEIGLFPQSSKIDMRLVTNPYEEIKSVSRVGAVVFPPAKDQERLRKQLTELCKGGAVASDCLTRFKYLLARATPHHQLNGNLLKVLKVQPSLSANICAYFGKYRRLPRKSAEGLLQCLTSEESYHSVQADILMAVFENMVEPYRTYALGYCTERMPKKGYLPPQPTLKAALNAWLLRYGKLSYTEAEVLLKDEIDWWIVKDALKYLQQSQYGPASYEAILNDFIKGPNSEPARVAALKIVDENLSIRVPFKKAHEAARLLLYAGGKIRQIGKVESLVGIVLCSVLDVTLPTYDWATLFGVKHKDAEHIAFTVRRDYESNINSCIVTLDSLCDLLFEKLFKKYLPTKIYGNYGGMLKNPAMRAALPKTCNGFATLHSLRLESVTAHPRDEKTGRSTRRLKHYDLYRVRPCLREAFQEITTRVT